LLTFWQTLAANAALSEAEAAELRPHIDALHMRERALTSAPVLEEFICQVRDSLRCARLSGAEK
jgi:hypothetical protein